MTDQPRDVWGSTVDVLGSESRTHTRRGGPLGGGTVIGALAAVISVVMAAGIFAAASLSGGGPQPEQVLPGTAFAFAKLDLDPPAGQKLAVRELASKFPKAPAKDVEGLRDELVRAMIEDVDEDLSYEADVKPWLGRRVGIAGFRPAGGEATAVVAIQTTDRQKAEDTIRTAASDVAFAFRDGYAILAENRTVLDAALDATSKGSLADDPGFRADVGSVGGERIALVWTDNAALAAATAEDDPIAEELRGRTVVGLSASGSHVEVESVTIDGGARPAAGGTDTLRRLPDDTVGALLVHNPSAAAEQALAVFGAASYAVSGLYVIPFFLYGGYGGYGGDGGDGFEDSCVVAVPAIPPGTTPQPLPSHFEDCHTSGPEPEPETANTAFGGDYGEAAKVFEKSVLPLLRGETTLAFGSVPDDGEDRYDAGLVARINGPGNAVEPFGDLLEALGVTVPPKVDGDLVYAATSAAYADKLVRGGRLGEQDLFTSAMGPLDGDVAAALYVNLDAIEKALPDYPDELSPVDALGMSVTSEGNRVTTRFRVVVR